MTSSRDGDRPGVLAVPRTTDPLTRTRRQRSWGAPQPRHSGPPGWPASVPPPDVEGWQGPALAWLLDHCPPDYRAYAAWRRHPAALAWVATCHIEAQLEAMRAAYRRARVELGEQLGSEALADVLADLEAEGVRMLAAQRSAGLLYDAMQGRRYVPRL
ncbi:MAG: hypothetical protein LWW86_00455 [Micrococcales bacterium]|nr:hypothetical protein [Micrococcales bacterium]